MDRRVQILLDRITGCFKEALGSDLTGVYVHGSLAFGCFTWETGDVDLIVVVKKEPDHFKKRALIRSIMAIEADAPPKGIELSVLLEADCRHFTHPMPYVMHYSKGHATRYLEDPDGHIRRLRGTDRDLAAHITVMHAVGYELMGPKVECVFSKVPAADYIDALMYDIEDAAQNIHQAPVYTVLNLCRVLAYVEEGRMISKDDGGEWGKRNLPEGFVPTVESALEAYRTGGDREKTDRASEEKFALYMLERIVRGTGGRL